MHTYGFLVGPALISAAALIILGLVVQRNSANRAAAQRSRDNLAVAVARTNRGRHAQPRADYLGSFPGTDSDSHRDGDSITKRPVNGRPRSGPVRIFRTRVSVPGHFRSGRPDSRVA